jgi:hypothetical protein
MEERISELSTIWRSFNSMRELKSVRPNEISAKVAQLSLEIRDDKEGMRAFYENHRPRFFPPSKFLDEEWALFRWTQVQLLAGLDFYASYGLDKEPNRENFLHELLDLDYLIPALLIGGLACRETRFIDRFRLLRSDGVVLK